MYTCTVVNNMTDIDGHRKQGVGVCRTILTVLSSPPITTVSAFEGNNAVLSLPAPPNPALYMYEWKKIGSDTFRRSYRPAIHNVKRSDAGKYIVRLRKKSTETVIMKDIYHIQRRVILVVLYPPDVVCPLEHTALENTSFTLTCQIDSSPPPNFITWSQGSSILQNSTLSQLVIHRAQRVGTAGLFTCTVTNSMLDYKGITRSGVASCGVMVYVQFLANIGRSEAGEYIINVVNFMNVTEGMPKEGHGVQIITVEVHYPPDVSCKNRYIVPVNESVNLTCSAQSDPIPHKIMWSKEGFNSTLQNGPEMYFQIRNVSMEDAGVYTCTVVNNMTDIDGHRKQGVGVCRTILTVLSSPPITTVSAFEGNNAVLSLPAPPNPALYMYEWKKIGSDTFRRSYRPAIHNVKRSDAGKYIVRLRKKSTETVIMKDIYHIQRRVILVVLYPPDVVCPLEHTALENTSFTLTCQIDSSPPPNFITWSQGSSILQNSTLSQLVIHRAQRVGTAGLFTCTVTNSMLDYKGITRSGVASCGVMVYVQYPPPPLLASTIDVFEGKAVRVLVPVDSDPVPHMYQWRKDDVWSTFRSSSNPPEITNVSRSGAGGYIVKVTNKMNITGSGEREGHGVQMIKLRVLYEPTMFCQSEYSILEYEPINITCKASSFPVSNLTWSREGQLLKTGSSNHLTLYRPSRRMSGIYTCTATNKMIDTEGVFKRGTGACRMNITVLYPPPPLVSASISVFEGSNLTLSQPVFSYPQPYSFEWKLRDTLSDYRSSDEPPVLTNIQRTEAGRYMIRIRNNLPITQGAHRDGQGMQFINVKVLYAPEVSCQEQYLVARNSSVNLTCQVDSFPRPNQVTWYWTGSNSTLKEGKALYLRVENIQVNQSGIYTCSISNVMEDSFGVKEFGNMSCMMSIAVVYAAPSRVTGYLSVYEGDNVTVSLPAQSAPPPHVYSWRKEGETTQFTDHPSPPTLNNILRSESGLYIIKLINSLNLTHEKPRKGHGMQIVTVDVLFGPELTCTKDVYFLRGSTSALEAKVESNPGPSSVTWGRISKANLDTGFTPVVTQPASPVAEDKEEGRNLPYLEEEDLIEVSTKSSLPAISTISMKTDSTTESGSGTSAKVLLYSGEGSGDDPEEIKASKTSSGETSLQEVKGLVNVYSGGREYESSAEIELFQNIQGSADQLSSEEVDSALSRVKRGADRMKLRSDRLFTQEDEFSGDELAQLSANEDIISGHDASEEADVNIIDVNDKMTNSEKSKTLKNELRISRKDESGSGGFEIEHLNGSSMYQDFDNLSETITDSSWHSQIDASGSGSGDELEQTQASGFSSYKHDANSDLWTFEHSGEFSGSGLGSGDITDGDNSSISSEVANITDTMMMPETVREGFVQYEKFYLTDIQSSDEGMYEFTASNIMVDYTGKKRNETASCSINLHVLYPPPRDVSASKSVFERTDVLLSLPPGCLPLPSSYRWRKEDPGTTFITDINPPIISNINREDSGSYIIEVTNMMNLTHGGIGEGRGLQHVTLTVLYGPEVNCMNYVVRRNSTVTLSCHIQGVPSPSSITWSHDDAIIHIGSNSFVMTNIHSTDTGQYRCDVTSTLIDYMGRSETRSASCISNVTVLIPPIPLRSGHLQVFEDEDLPLSLPDPCLPAPHLYTWRQVSPSTGPLHQTTSPPLLLHTLPADAGLYLVKLSNRMDVTHGESSEGHGVQFVSVKVLARPTIDCPNEYTSDALSNVTMTCSVSHALNSSTLTWHRGLEYLGNQSSVTITNTTESHTGTYTCTVSTTLVDSWGRIKSWTSVCNTKLSLITGFKASVSPFGLLPPQLLPYIIYVGGSFLVLVFVVILGTAATAGIRVRGLHAQKRQSEEYIQLKGLSSDAKTSSGKTSSTDSLKQLKVADDEVLPA